MKSLNYFYDDYLDIEASAEEILSKSLHPRGPHMLYEFVEKLGLSLGASVLDVGCGEGDYALELVRRFGVRVLGVDPISRHIQMANDALHEAAEETPSLRNSIRFSLGNAEDIPAEDHSVDFIWCRDVLSHVEHLEKAFAEFRRVLKPGGRILILHSLATPLLEPKEAAWLWSTMRVVPANTNPEMFESLLAGAKLQIEESVELKSEWKEFAEEKNGRNGKKLLYAARLQRDPDFYISKFGKEAYDILLGDYLWAIYQMIGKLSYQVYLISSSA